MIITNNSQSQSLRIIPRESNISYTGTSSPKTLAVDSLYITLIEDGTGQTTNTTNTSSSRYDNYLQLNFNQLNTFFREGYYYNMEVCTNDTDKNLVYRDKLFVLPNSQAPYNPKERYTINPNVSYLETPASSDEYIIFNEDGSYNYNTDSSAYASEADSISGGGTVVPEGTNYDTDNDGYGEFYFIGSTQYNKGENIIGEYTVNESQYGTFSTASAYTTVDVLRVNNVHPSNYGTLPYYSQNGLADYTNGGVSYTQGHDPILSEYALRFFMDSVQTTAGNTISSLAPTANNFREVTVYINSSNTGFSVGDSVYSDNQGTMLASGTTNGRKNRYWFYYNNNVIKVTAGVVTHVYDWRNKPEGIVRYNVDRRQIKFAKREIINNIVTDYDDVDVNHKGKEWSGDAETGSLVTISTLNNKATEIQNLLDNDYFYKRITLTTAHRGFYLDFRNNNTTPFITGETLYERNLGYNAFLRLLKDDITPVTEPTSITLSDGSTFSLSYKSGETFFAALPIYGNKNNNSYRITDTQTEQEKAVGKGIILVEYNKYTGVIIDHKILYRNES
tara:strand:- start:2421 stop:4103 length:1683 start_codon:yes stop_codon:yes gene_type:complete